MERIGEMDLEMSMTRTIRPPCFTTVTVTITVEMEGTDEAICDDDGDDEFEKGRS
jgi:hypothetical protein